LYLPESESKKNMKNNDNRQNDRKVIMMRPDKKIALVAHDNKKHDLMEWAKYNKTLLAHHKIYATGTTGTLLEKEIGLKIKNCRVVRLEVISRLVPRLSIMRLTS
jgi:hypothetical protein